MFELKPLSREGVEAAIAKAEHYRLLNDPLMAESICRDILAVDPESNKANKILLLALTDQFSQSGTQNKVKEAREVAQGFTSEYEKLYFDGLVHERLGTAAIHSNVPGSQYDAYEYYIDAMEFYEKAEPLRPAGNDDPILRWNTCARIIQEYNLGPRPKDDFIPILE